MSQPRQSPQAADVAQEHHAVTQSYVDAAAQVAGQMWSQVDPANIAQTWVQQLPELTATVSGAQLGVARQADGYVADALDAQALDTASMSPVAPGGFAGVTSDGGGLASLLANPIVTVLTSIPGLGVPGSMELGGRHLDTIVRTQVADAGRLADQVALTAHPAADGYTRITVGGSCSRCLILAGKFYRWNAGFARHPRCDCKHVPTKELDARGLIRDPYDLYRAMSPAERLRAGFTLGDQRALAEGADMNQVVNATRGVYVPGRAGTTRRIRRPDGTTTEGTTRRGLFGGYRIDPETGRILGRRAKGEAIPARLTPDEIFARAGGDRAEALRLLHSNGYLSEVPSAAASEVDRLALAPRERILASTPAGGFAEPGAAVQVRHVLAMAQTPEQVSRVLEAEYAQITKRQLTADLTGSVETAREHAEGVLRAVEQHPDIRLSVVRTGPTAKAKSYAEAHVGQQELVFSQHWSSVESRGDYLRAMAADEKAGWHPAGTGNAAGVAAHEVGHLFDVASSRLDRAVDDLLFAAQRQTGVPLERGVRLGISQYATTSRRELMAEAFSDVVTNGERASGLSRAVVRAMEEHRGPNGGVIIARPLASTPRPPTLAALKRKVTDAGITIPTGAPRGVVENLVDALERGVAPAQARATAVREMLELRGMVGDKLAEVSAALENGASARAMAYHAKRLRRLSSGEGGLGFPTRAVPELGKPLQDLIAALERGDAAAAKAALPKAVTGSKLKALGEPGAVVSRSKLGSDVSWVGSGRGDVVEVLHPGYTSTLEGKTVTVAKPSVRAATPEQAQALRSPAKKAAAPKPPAGATTFPAGRAQGDNLLRGDDAEALARRVNRGPTPEAETDRTLRDIAQLQGFAGRPITVSSEEFDRLAAELTARRGLRAEVVYRSVRASGSRSAEAIHEQLAAGIYDARRGIYGSGIHTSPRLGLSEQYAGSDGKGVVGRYLIHPQAVGVDYRALLRDQERFLASLPKGSAAREVFSDPGHYAAARGYDYIKAPSGPVVLNRTALIADRRAYRPGEISRSAPAATTKAAPAKKAAVPRKAAAPSTMGSAGLSTDAGIRAGQVENRIRQAAVELGQRPGARGFANVEDLRARIVGAEVSDDEFRAVMLTMRNRQDVTVVGGFHGRAGLFAPSPKLQAARAAVLPDSIRVEGGYHPVDLVRSGKKVAPAKATTAKPAPKATPAKAPAKKAAMPRVPKPPVPEKMSLPALRTEMERVVETANARPGAAVDLAGLDLGRMPKPVMAELVTRARALQPEQLRAEVARWRTIVVQRRTTTADLLSEVDQLLDSGASARTLATRIEGTIRRAGMDAAAKAWPDAAEAQKILTAARTGDPAKVRRAVAAAEKKLGLQRVGEQAGSVVRYDRTAMDAISGAKIPADAHVVVVRPGYRMADGTVLSKPVVEEATAQEVAAASVVRKLTPAQAERELKSAEDWAQAARDGRVSRATAAKQIREKAQGQAASAGLIRSFEGEISPVTGQPRRLTAEELLRVQRYEAEAARLRALADEISAGPARKATRRRIQP